jgi:hypothetical protein
MRNCTTSNMYPFLSYGTESKRICFYKTSDDPPPPKRNAYSANNTRFVQQQTLLTRTDHLLCIRQHTAGLLHPVPALIRGGQSRWTRLARVSSYFPMTGGKISWILCVCICILRPNPSFTKDNNNRQNVLSGETNIG